MLILKFNSLSAEDLFSIERRLLKWLDNGGTDGSPDFNVLDFGRTDLYGHLLGIFGILGLFETLGVSPSELLDFFIDVDMTYLNAPYHSFYHAVDIVTMLYFMLSELGAARYLTKHEIAALLLSALCHDAGHPGYNNLYQVNFKTDLAQRYNDTSVLESYSVDITHDLIRKHDLLKGLKQSTDQSCMTEAEFMTTIGDLILSTDMVYHYELQKELGILEDILAEDDILTEEEVWSGSTDEYSDMDTFSIPETALSSARESLSGQLEDDIERDGGMDNVETRLPLLLCAEHRQSLCRILLHAADISNTVRPWPISKQWSDLIVQEFFRQGDAEKANGMCVSPGMDRDQATQPIISLKFGDFVVKPYFEALADVLPPAKVFLDALAENRTEWERLDQCPAAASPPLCCGERQFPASLLPPKAVLNPTGRRVSVAAGIVVIADEAYQLPRQRQRSTMSIPQRRTLGFRNASHAGIPFRMLAKQKETEKESLVCRRASEQTHSNTFSPLLFKPVVFSPSVEVFDTDERTFVQNMPRSNPTEAS